MIKYLKFFIPFIFFHFFHSGVRAQDKILFPAENSGSIPIGNYVYLFHDQHSVYSNSEIIDLDSFVSENKDIPVFSNVIDGIIWAKFSISNINNLPDLYLDLPYANISEISLPPKTRPSSDRRLQLACVKSRTNIHLEGWR